MTIIQAPGVPTNGLPYERAVCPDRLGAVLLRAAALAFAGRDCGKLITVPALGRYGATPPRLRRQAQAAAGWRRALPAHLAHHIDAEKIAWDITERYRASRYPGVVIGSPHGAAVHLAAALGMPWLPEGFEMSVRWPDGAVDDPTGALIHGMPVTATLLANNPDMAVRQAHDPCTLGVVAGSTVTLIAHWRRIPAAYRAFFGHRLAAGAPLLVIGDARRWPVFNAGGGHTFQVGGPSGGITAASFLHRSSPLHHLLRHTGGDPHRWQPPAPCPAPTRAQYAVDTNLTEDLERYANGHGRQLRQVWYDDPHALSAGTADLYRQWLRAAGKTGNRIVVECGTLLDPYQVIRAGLIPYWCEAPVEAATESARRWLAHANGCTSVDVLPQPPGSQHPAATPMHEWDSIARYGQRRGVVDPTARHRYPDYPLPPRHATRVLRGQAYDLPQPPPLSLATALDSLQDRAGQGLLVT